MERYITLDWDGIAPVMPTVTRKLREALEYAGNVWKVRIKEIWWRSSSNGNTHILMKVDAKMTTYEQIVLRAILGDDRRRLAWDTLRVESDSNTYATGVLFDMKDGKEAGKWRRFKW